MYFHFDILVKSIEEFEDSWMDWQDCGEKPWTEPYMEEFVMKTLKENIQYKDMSEDSLKVLAEIYTSFLLIWEVEFCNKMEKVVTDPISKATFAIVGIIWNYFETELQGMSFLSSTFPDILKYVNNLLWDNKIKEFDSLVIWTTYQDVKKPIDSVLEKYKINEFYSSLYDFGSVGLK